MPNTKHPHTALISSVHLDFPLRIFRLRAGGGGPIGDHGGALGFASLNINVKGFELQVFDSTNCKSPALAAIGCAVFVMAHATGNSAMDGACEKCDFAVLSLKALHCAN